MEAKVKRFFPDHRQLTWLLAVSLATYACAMAGCGNDRPPTVPVQGCVQYRGKPLKFGAVIFQPEMGSPATGVIQSDGSFRLSTEGRDGAIVGKHKVAISCYDTEEPGHARDPKGRLGKLLIPQRYVYPQSSGLTAEVKAKNEPFRLELVD
jgi:hypothetical protein